MAKRKKTYQPKAFEHDQNSGAKPVSANIYASMLESAAFIALSRNAQMLYIYMKLQYYGGDKVKNQQGEELGLDCFYFNWAMANKRYNLYSNSGRFYKDIEQLVQYGFIDVLESGKTTRTKNIYKFSSRWAEISQQLERKA